MDDPDGLNTFKQLIVNSINECTDTILLDLIYKLLNK